MAKRHRCVHSFLLQFRIICEGRGRLALFGREDPAYTEEIYKYMEDRIISYGGQAVIEGVMMRGQKAYAIAMRAPDG